MSKPAKNFGTVTAKRSKKKKPFTDHADPTVRKDGALTGRLASVIFEQIGEPVIVCDSAGNILLTSQVADRYCQPSCLHRPFDEVFHLSYPTDKKVSMAGNSSRLSRKFIKRVLEGKTLHREEVCFTQPDGTVVNILLNARPLKDEDQIIIGGILTFVDLEILKRSDSILEGHNEILEQIIKDSSDSSLSVFLGNLCREIEHHFPKGGLASILLLDEEGRHLILGAAPSLPQSYLRAIEGIEIGPEVGACGAAAFLRESVFISNISEHPNWSKYKDVAESHGLRACWSMPIVASDGHALGTFGLYYTVHRLPSDEEKEFVEFLARSASIAIEKVQAQERFRQQAHALEAVNRIGSSLSAELNLEKLVQSVTDACRELSGAEFGAFFYNVVNDNGESYVLYTISGVPREAFANFPMPRNTPIFAPTFSGEAVIRLGDVTSDTRYGQIPPYHGMPPGHLPVRSYLAVPVISRSGEVLGALFFGHSKPNVFSQTAEKIVTGIASQAAIAIDNARLYQSAQKEIEERKRTAENLKRLAAIVESSEDAIFSINTEGVITSWNNGAERMYGYPSSEIIGQPLSCLLLPASHQDNFSLFGHLLKKAGATTYEALRLKKNGMEFPVSLSTSPIYDMEGFLTGASLIERDISEQKRIEVALETSESRLQSILDNSPAVIFVKDLLGSYQLINKRFESIFQLSREQIIGKTDLDILSPQLARLVRTNDQLVLESRTPQEFEETVDLQNELRVYLSMKFPLYDTDGNPYALGGMATDISERKKAEQALKELNDSLEQRVADRTRDMIGYQENLRAMASELVLTEQRERRRLAVELHDYLAQLLVVCRMKLTQLTNDRRVQAVKTDLEEIDQFISDSLSYTRTLIAELSPTILYELGLIPALVWVAQQMERHGLHVPVNHQDQKIQIPEDQAIFIFQAVRELLFNVVKHADVTEATVSVRLTSAQEVEVLVQDSGKGFHPSSGPSDYTIPGKFGLFSIRERTEALGGLFHLDSAPERGTLAKLVIPLQRAPAPVQKPKDGKGEQPLSRFIDGDARKKSVRIVLVDDHAMIRQGIRTLLDNQSDFMVVGEAQNGEEALNLIESLLPDIVVMDVNMPKLNGIEATKILTQQHPLVKVVGLSVHEDKHVENLLLEAGAATYVTKSSVASQLVEAIRHVVTSQR